MQLHYPGKKLSMECADQLTDQIDKDSSEKKVIPSELNSRPALSYVGLIALAIQSHPEKKMRLSEIYEWMVASYPYFKSKNRASWRNSVRHNLSLNECFVKVGHGQHGKGHCWRIHSANEVDFARGDFRRRNARMKVINGGHCDIESTFMIPDISRQCEVGLFLKDRQIYGNLQCNNWPLCSNGYETMGVFRTSLGNLANMFGLESVTSPSERQWLPKSRARHSMAPYKSITP